VTATPAPAPDDDGPLHVLVRVWLPDRPGALGLVASRIGAVEGDIVGIDVLEQGDGVAVDEFAVLLRRSVSLDLLVREILEVDGTKVEEVRTIGHFPDPRLDALESATSLCQVKTADDLPQVLVEHIRDEFLADWSLLMADGEVRASAGEPDLGPDDLALAELRTHDATLLVARDGRAFRRRERAQLMALAGIADRVWSLLH
jgi:hypothetical protein